MDTKQIIRDFYNSSVQVEWNRIGGRPEFLLTCRYLDRYIKPGDRVLDIGGGPGRYSLYLAEKGCEVTLFDLSDGNTAFAEARAAEMGLSLKTVCGDACIADELVHETFDHVLLMGPLYHLLEEADRIQAVNASLSLLKTGGEFFVSFINLFSGIIYAMKLVPEWILCTAPTELRYMEDVISQRSFGGDAFTKAFFIAQHEVLPFMSQFPLEKLHLFGQEGITSPCEKNLLSQPADVINGWLDYSEKLCEREDLLSWSEHLIYVGRKIEE